MYKIRSLNFLFIAGSAVLGVLFFSHSAYAVRLPIYLGMSYPGYEQGGTKFKSNLGFVGGLGIEFSLSPVTAIEIGAQFMMRSFGTGTSKTVMNWIKIPVLYRIWLGNIFTIGAGAYYASGMGNLSVNGTSNTFESQGYGKTDGGLVGAVGFNIPIAGFNVILEGRYTYGMFNISTVANVIGKFNDVLFLTGIRF